MGKSIYNIQEDYWKLMSEIEENDGELTDDLEERLHINQNELEDKAVNYGYVIRQYDVDIEQINEEIKRLKKIADSKSRIQGELKERVKSAMMSSGIEKVNKNNLTLSFRRSKQLIIDEGASVPSDFITIKEVESVDKAGLKKAIESGQEFTGIFIWENFNLQIK